MVQVLLRVQIEIKSWVCQRRGADGGQRRVTVGVYTDVTVYDSNKYDFRMRRACASQGL